MNTEYGIALQKIIELEAQVAALEAEQQEPVAWAIYTVLLCEAILGEPSDVFINKQTAELECARRDKLYPDPTRQFIPLYAAPKGQK